MITNQLKRNIILGWLLYVFRSFLQVSFRFHCQLINFVWLSIDLSSFSWSQSRPQSNLKQFSKISFLLSSYSDKTRWSQGKAETSPFTFWWLYILNGHLPKTIATCFLQKGFLVLILHSTSFICLTWKRKETMEQQQHRAYEWTKSNKKNKTKATSYWNLQLVLLLDLSLK